MNVGFDFFLANVVVSWMIYQECWKNSCRMLIFVQSKLLGQTRIWRSDTSLDWSYEIPEHPQYDKIYHWLHAKLSRLTFKINATTSSEDREQMFFRFALLAGDYKTLNLMVQSGSKVEKLDRESVKPYIMLLIMENITHRSKESVFDGVKWLLENGTSTQVP